MPSVLICPMCGAPLMAGMTGCEYCGAHFDAPVGATSPAEGETRSAHAPETWKEHLDPWYGFVVAHPPGWWVNARPGSVGVREDPAGFNAATVMTLPNGNNLPAREFFQTFLNSVRQFMPDFAAWEAPGNANQPDRLAVRFQVTLLGVPLAGFYDVMVQKNSAMISGFSSPVNIGDHHIDTFRKILASFRPTERMERVIHREPSENAYAIWAPAGWQANLQLNRQNINNMGTIRFVVQREPQGFAQASMPDMKWRFTEGSAWGMPSLLPVMPYMPAGYFLQNVIAPQAAQSCQDMKVECITDRPDLAVGLYIEMRKIGMDTTGYEVTCATMDIVYQEGGRQLRQRGLASVTHPPNMVAGGEWDPSLSWVIRAPVEEWEALEPVLMGVIDSNQLNPDWKAQEDASRMRYLAYSASDRMRRQQQISQTISETSDMMFQSYQNRSRTEDRIMHEWSNATLGVQDMADSSGTAYSVPSGYDQYWLDNSDTLRVGNWLANPDPTWRKLEPQ